MSNLRYYAAKRKDGTYGNIYIANDENDARDIAKQYGHIKEEEMGDYEFEDITQTRTRGQDKNEGGVLS